MANYLITVFDVSFASRINYTAATNTRPYIGDLKRYDEDLRNILEKENITFVQLFGKIAIE